MSLTRLAGRVITSPAARARPAELVIDGNRVAAVASASAPLRPDAPWVVPGLIDAHVHPLETGLALLFADLSGCTALEQVLARIAGNLPRVSESPVTLAFNLDPEALAERRYPGLAELDALAPERPLLVYRVDGHSAATNRAGLDLLGDVQAPGIETGADARPTGVLRGPAFEQASLGFKRRLPADVVREAIALAGRRLAAAGITAFGALVGSDELSAAEWAVLVDALAALPIRAVPYLQAWNPEVARGFGLSQTGGCLLLDGSFGSRTAALSSGYADAPAELGLLYHDDAEIVACIRQAADLGLSTAFHAIGDQAVEQLVRGHELAALTPSRLRHRIEHAELLRPDLIERINRLGLVLSVQPAFETEWGGPDRMYRQRLGERWRETNPLAASRSAGIRLAGGSDSPITPADPLAGIRSAMTLPNADHRLSGPEALALFTTDAAYSLNLEAEAGVLAPGRPADFVLLDRDPRLGPGPGRVLATWRAGQCIHRS